VISLFSDEEEILCSFSSVLTVEAICVVLHNNFVAFMGGL